MKNQGGSVGGVGMSREEVMVQWENVSNSM